MWLLDTLFTRWSWLDERTHQAHIKLSSSRPDGTCCFKDRLNLTTCLWL